MCIVVEMRESASAPAPPLDPRLFCEKKRAHGNVGPQREKHNGNYGVTGVGAVFGVLR
jgi:hypothetical protein